MCRFHKVDCSCPGDGQVMARCCNPDGRNFMHDACYKQQSGIRSAGVLCFATCCSIPSSRLFYLSALLLKCCFTDMLIVYTLVAGSVLKLPPLLHGEHSTSSRRFGQASHSQTSVPSLRPAPAPSSPSYDLQHTSASIHSLPQPVFVTFKETAMQVSSVSKCKLRSHQETSNKQKGFPRQYVICKELMRYQALQ